MRGLPSGSKGISVILSRNSIGLHGIKHTMLGLRGRMAKMDLPTVAAHTIAILCSRTAESHPRLTQLDQSKRIVLRACLLN